MLTLISKPRPRAIPWRPPSAPLPPNKCNAPTLDGGTPVHRFSTLLAELATVVGNMCCTPHTGPDAPKFDVLTTPNPKEQRAIELIQRIHPKTETGTAIQPKCL